MERHRGLYVPRGNMMVPLNVAHTFGYSDVITFFSLMSVGGNPSLVPPFHQCSGGCCCFGSLESTGPNRVRSLTIGFGKSLTIADDRATIFGGDPTALFPLRIISAKESKSLAKLVGDYHKFVTSNPGLF